VTTTGRGDYGIDVPGGAGLGGRERRRDRARRGRAAHRRATIAAWVVLVIGIVSGLTTVLHVRYSNVIVTKPS